MAPASRSIAMTGAKEHHPPSGSRWYALKRLRNWWISGAGLYWRQRLLKTETGAEPTTLRVAPSAALEAVTPLHSIRDGRFPPISRSALEDAETPCRTPYRVHRCLDATGTQAAAWDAAAFLGRRSDLYEVINFRRRSAVSILTLRPLRSLVSSAVSFIALTPNTVSGISCSAINASISFSSFSRSLMPSM